VPGNNTNRRAVQVSDVDVCEFAIWRSRHAM
jgi:hypothetical protein